MRKRKEIILMMFLLLCSLVCVIRREADNKEIETLQTVKESDIEDLLQMKKTINGKTEKEEYYIRVLIMGNGYKGETHEKVEVSSKDEMQILYGDIVENIPADEIFPLEPDDKRFEKGNIKVSSDKKLKLEHLERGYGNPSYEGEMELISTAEGIVIINELPVEEYLKAVVPSEMPASYELEALKAQAVCARTYAYRQMENYGYPEYEAHVNDSTAYQVYGNAKSQKSTNQAIKSTKGQAVYYQGEMAMTYYYSTSCGKTTDIRAWGTKKGEKNAYLKAVKVKGKQGYYEKNLPWYRWSAEISQSELSNLIGLNTGKDIGQVKDIEVTKRGGGDVALEIKVTGGDGNLTVKTENKIRKALGGAGYRIVLQDGSVTKSRELLPSAFFTIEKSGDMFVIKGGGFGHGIGMSQNGANEMAKQGKNYREILELFYQDIEIR